MASETFLELVVQAYQSGLECTLNDLRQLPDFVEFGALSACSKIEVALNEKGLELNPSVSEGELDQVRVVSRISTPERFILALKEALQSDEGQEVEFKESLYLKKKLLGMEKVPKDKWVSDDLVFECIKTICAFLNSDGGTLLIGVSDVRDICGIDCELDFIPVKSGTLDGWELFFSSCLEKYIYDYRSCIGHISRKLVSQDGLTICVVIVRPRRQGITVCRRPAQMNDEIVYVRNGNGSAEIKARAIEALVRSRLSE
ncbi:ATP-binding protein [Hoeflea sp. AS16]|uniref:AlbA family DNA-binding domain-containing protein n=1 Tax=Hoeflea sp. AS16 TaxID=3135779 RepID=UPI003177F137